MSDILLWAALLASGFAVWLAWRATDVATQAASTANSARVQTEAARDRVQAVEDRERGRAILARRSTLKPRRRKRP